MNQIQTHGRTFLHHPDTCEGEVFIGNMSLNFYNNECGYKTKRAGATNRCLLADGTMYNGDNIVPVFVSKDEIRAAGFEVRP